MPYFLIHNNDDGDFYFREIDPDRFLKDIHNGVYGDPEKMNFLSQSAKIQEKMTEWRGGMYLIIRGEIVFPSPRKTVSEWKF